MRFSMCTVAVRFANCNARTTKLSGEVGTPCANGPLTLMTDGPGLMRNESCRSSVIISASMRWNPSLRTPTTRSESVSLAGASST